MLMFNPPRDSKFLEKKGFSVSEEKPTWLAAHIPVEPPPESQQRGLTVTAANAPEWT